MGDRGATGAGVVAAREVECAPAGAAISSTRMLASLMVRAGLPRRGGFRQGGFPLAVETREQPFERSRAGCVHALGGGSLGRQDQQQASLARGLPYRAGRAPAGAPRSARAVGSEGSSSPTVMVFSSRPCGSSRSTRGLRGPLRPPRGVRSPRPDLHAHPLVRRVVDDDAVDRPSGGLAAEPGR